MIFFSRIESDHAAKKSLIQHKPKKVDELVDYSEKRIAAVVRFFLQNSFNQSTIFVRNAVLNDKFRWIF